MHIRFTRNIYKAYPEYIRLARNTHKTCSVYTQDIPPYIQQINYAP